MKRDGMGPVEHASTIQQPVLRVEDLRVSFGPVVAVEGLSFEIARGQTLGLIGESGCGKSLTAMALLGLSHLTRAQVRAQRLELLGEDLTQADAKRWRGIRGKRIGVIFQEPMSSLNPVLRIGAQIAEAIEEHEPIGRKASLERAADLLQQVRIADPRRALAQYPHELSGGMRQRVMIAIALANQPDLLIADEPTTALDVTVQRQVLDLIDELRATRGISVLLITHNLGLVAEYCDRAVVMYAGRAVEALPVQRLFGHAQHPYTGGLLRAMPRVRPHRAITPLQEIPGSVPGLAAMPGGCRFAARCPSADSACREVPPLQQAGEDHRVACWHPGSPWEDAHA